MRADTHDDANAAKGPINRVATLCVVPYVRGARWRGWLRHYATNRQVAGSIPDGVTVIFQ